MCRKLVNYLWFRSRDKNGLLGNLYKEAFKFTHQQMIIDGVKY